MFMLEKETELFTPHRTKKMRNTRCSLAGTLTALVAFVALLVTGALAADSGTLSKKELKRLSASNEPADQQKLAAYYQEKSRQLMAKSEAFAKQAESLAREPATIESKQGISCNCPSHYRYFSKLYAQEANEDQALAARHEQLAHDYLSRSAAQK